MLVVARGSWAAVALVTGEQAAGIAFNVARQRHQGAPRRQHERAAIGARDARLLREGKGKHIAQDLAYRPHDAKPKVAAVADRERPAQRCRKRDLGMPEPLLGEARTRLERLGARAAGLERLALHADGGGPRSHPGVAQRRGDGSDGAGLLGEAFAPQLGLCASGGRIATRSGHLPPQPAAIDASPCRRLR
jgi:hypothetical protein